MTRNRIPNRRALCAHLVLLVLLAAPGLACATQATVDGMPAAALNPRVVAAQARAGLAHDRQIASTLAGLLLRQPSLRDVVVDVDGGIVTLDGTVPEEADRNRAVLLARQVHGVSEVVDTIRLDSNLGTRFRAATDQGKEKLIRIVAAAPLLAVAIFIVLLAWWIGRLVGRRPAAWLRERSHNPYMEGLVRRGVQAAIVLLGVLLALNLLGATALVSAVLGSAGVIGLAFGFAFRDVAENYIAGVLLSLRRPFAPGDQLVIDKYEGKVVALTSRATLLMTLDGNHLSLPNALVFKSVVLNYSVNPKRRFSFAMQIDPGESIRRAQQLAIGEIAGVEGVLSDPAPSSVIDSVGVAGISLTFYGWVDQRGCDLNKVRSEALRSVKSAFARSGIAAPRTVQYVITTHEEPDLRPPSSSTAAAEPETQGDTSVNRDIDHQLADAQRATDAKNLLDTQVQPADGDVAARTP
jgi:small conductance mechanosensitive channel